MGAPSVPYKIIPEGYTVSGGPNGLQAVVPFLVDWINAFTFVDEIMGSPSAAVVGPVSYAGPWWFPGAPDSNMVALSFAIEPIGTDGEPLPWTGGLLPGEHFTLAKITVTFGTPAYDTGGGGGGASNPLNQLDPSNPITYCTQSVEMGGRFVYKKANGYEFEDSTPVAADLGKVEAQSTLVLTFPKIPFLPRNRVRPFVGTLNDRTVLGAPKGCLLFEGMGTQATATNQGLQGQQVQLRFNENSVDWNLFQLPGTASLHYVYEKGHIGEEDKRLYQYMDFRQLFFQ